MQQYSFQNLLKNRRFRISRLHRLILPPPSADVRLNIYRSAAPMPLPTGIPAMQAVWELVLPIAVPAGGSELTIPCVTIANPAPLNVLKIKSCLKTEKVAPYANADIPTPKKVIKLI